MPALEKNLIDSCLSQIDKTYSDFPVFIESGTFMGESTNLASNLFEKVYTIELESSLYNRAVSLFKNKSNIDILFGDTIKLLPNILIKESRNSVFWLDGHNSGPGTAVGEIDFPALQECEIIDQYFTGDLGLILIDDVRLFGKGHSAQIDNSLIDLTIDKIITSFKKRSISSCWLADSNLELNDRLILFIK